jgi:dCMP deaminase
MLYKDTPADLVLGTACNEFPEGVLNKPERLERPLKYAMVEHAERGAIYDAAFSGNCTKGATMFVPWAACADCARAIICAGITNVVSHKPMMDKTPPHWKESIETAFVMLKEVGIQFELIDGTLEGPELLFNGEIWVP